MMGGIQLKFLVKSPEECPSGCKLRGRGLAVEMGEAVGQGGGTSMTTTLKMG